MRGVSPTRSERLGSTCAFVRRSCASSVRRQTRPDSQKSQGSSVRTVPPQDAPRSKPAHASRPLISATLWNSQDYSNRQDFAGGQVKPGLEDLVTTGCRTRKLSASCPANPTRGSSKKFRTADISGVSPRFGWRFSRRHAASTHVEAIRCEAGDTDKFKHPQLVRRPRKHHATKSTAASDCTLPQQ